MVFILKIFPYTKVLEKYNCIRGYTLANAFRTIITCFDNQYIGNTIFMKRDCCSTTC